MNYSKYISILLSVLFISFGCKDNNVEDIGLRNGSGATGDVKLVCTQFKTYFYAQADFLDSNTIYSIEYPEVISTAEIRPYKSNVAASIDGNKLKFKIPQPGHYVAYVNNKKVILFIEKPEIIPSGSNVRNIVSNYNCDTTGVSNETTKIQAAINDVAGTDDVLYFPPGKYKTSQIRIINKNSVNIYLARGARIVADTTDLVSYSTDNVFGAPATSSIVGKTKWTASRTFILIDQSQDINIKGYGMIDGQGRAARRNATVLNGSESRGRYRNFLITRSDNVLLENIISADPGVWNTHILKSENVTCDNVKLINELDYAPIAGDINNINHDNVNTDGFDIDASQNVLVRNCFAYCSDDNVAVKTSEYSGLLGNLDGVVVQNCVFITQKSSLKVGTETGASEMKNINFKNNDVLEADRAISVYCYDGAHIEARYENNRIESNYPDAKKALVHISVKPRVAGESLIGSCNIDIIDTEARVNFPQKSIVEYQTNQATGDGVKVKFRNFSVAGVKITSTNNTIFRYSGPVDVSFE